VQVSDGSLQLKKTDHFTAEAPATMKCPRFLPLITAGILFLAPLEASAQASNPAEAAKNWSLFFEYHKNGDFKTAAPYGWKVIQLDPTRFKTVYSKLADCYYNFYQNAADTTKRQAFADTMIIVYDLGIKNVPDRSSGLWLSKGYALATYFQGRDLEAIHSYEKAIELDPKTDFVYIDQLGLLYIKNMDKDPSLKKKAVDLYRAQHEKDSTNQVPVDRLKQLISDPQELVELAEADLKNDPTNPEKLWNAAQAHIDAEQYGDAEKHLTTLVKKFPKASNYTNELGKTYQKDGKYKQAIGAYEESLKLNPAVRENYLNIAVCYRQLKNYAAARSTAQKAAAHEKGWGQPYMEIAETYKAAVENCIKETKGGDWSKLDLDDKLVYKLAQESYRTAKSVESGLSNEANQRINELSTLVPSKEDIFFNKNRIVNGKMPIGGECYNWVGEQVSVSL
jgi:tetratricopeptide (TPR) repeat protein